MHLGRLGRALEQGKRHLWGKKEQSVRVLEGEKGDKRERVERERIKLKFKLLSKFGIIKPKILFLILL